MSEYQCRKCRKRIDASDAYEYRGAISCAECHDDVIQSRNRERAEIIAEESAKTEVFRGLDISSGTAIGRGNRELLAAQIEIASKESGRLRAYERGRL